MGDQNNFSQVGQRWSGWARIVGVGIALLAFGLGSGFIYNEVYKSPALNYTLLPEYNLGEQVFSGIVIENRGRIPLTEVRVIMADLGNAIETLNMPGAHEPVQIVEGGEGQSELHLLAPQLSTGESFSIYLLTNGPLDLGGNKLLVTSKEAVGKASTSESPGFVALLMLTGALTWAGMISILGRDLYSKVKPYFE